MLPALSSQETTRACKSHHCREKSDWLIASTFSLQTFAQRMDARRLCAEAIGQRSNRDIGRAGATQDRHQFQQACSLLALDTDHARERVPAAALRARPGSSRLQAGNAQFDIRLQS